MLFLAAPPIDSTVVLVGIVVVALLATLAGLAIKNLRRRKQSPAATPQGEQQPLAAAQAAVAQVAVVDAGALLAAVQEAEAEGASRRLPGLYLSLAQLRIESGDASAAGELLRKSIRVASGMGLNDAHAKARLALGDLAQASGDPATACEHWQIARKLFHELGQKREYDAVDARMLRNGCPTDWVLTDF